MERIRVTHMKTSRDSWQLRWKDRDGVPRQENLPNCKRRSQAIDAAVELERKLNATGFTLTWEQFFALFCQSYLDEMSPGHRTKCRTMSKKLLQVARASGIENLRCEEITKSLVVSVKATMRAEGLADATVKSNMASLWAVLHWGMDEDLIPEVKRPRERKGPKQKASTHKSKGRALTLEEIERMEAAVPSVCKPGEIADPVIRAMKAMQLIGLRLSDAWIFSWDPRENTHHPVRLNGKNPAIQFASEQKSGEESEVPLTPEAVEWLRSIEKDGGWVCRSIGPRGEHKTSNRLGRIISAAGKAGNIMVKPTGGKFGKPKFASSHDLRRTFATSLLKRFKSLAHVQVMTRHGDPQTLLNYYSDPQSKNVHIYEQLWDDRLIKYAEGIDAELSKSAD